MFPEGVVLNVDWVPELFEVLLKDVLPKDVDAGEFGRLFPKEELFPPKDGDDEDPNVEGVFMVGG